jgi:tRNA (cmo5U34)-methyltransferase
MSESRADSEHEDTEPHFDPVTYADEIRVDVPAYDELQAAVADAATESSSTESSSTRALDLGAGTGETSLALLARCPGAALTLFDESAEMLAAATARLPEASVANVIVADLLNPLPPGPFDVVVSCLAIHHLDGAGKQALFERVHAALAPGGRFVMGDVIVPEDPADAIAPLEEGYDVPDRLPDLVAWLGMAGFDANVVWLHRDLAVVAADMAR